MPKPTRAMNAARLAAATAAAAVAAALTVAVLPASAHDTWFEPLAAAPGGTLLALGTGNQFPRFDSGIDARYLVVRGCRAAASSTAAMPSTPALQPGVLQAVRNTDVTLVLRAPPQATTCWAQLTPFDVVLAPDKIELYLKDIQATPEVRATWAAMSARGLPWRERYTKHARIELGAASAEAAPLGLDVHIETAAAAAAAAAVDAASGPLRAKQSVTAVALRDGQPLPGLALELRSENSALGIWRRTDAQGRIALTVPLPGRWVLRGVDLRVASNDPDRWDSRFVTLAFEVLPALPAN